MKILVRLPNWLGDMVMSIGFINALHEIYPDAEVSVIVKSGLEELLDFFPPLINRYLFSRQEYSGAAGALQYGRDISLHEKYDLFFSLPDSFSAAAMGWMSRAKQRVGYKSEGRNFLLSHAYQKDLLLHRVDQYIKLAENFADRAVTKQSVLFRGLSTDRSGHLLVNINSEASSRRLPEAKAISLITLLRSETADRILLIGGKNDREFVSQVISALPQQQNIENLAGETSLKELVHLMRSSAGVLTTDSGPAHLANACRTPAVVLFGAGNEKNTAPYNKEHLQVIRYGKLPCEPCVKNKCVLFGLPKCLASLDEQEIVSAFLSQSASRP